MNERRTSSDMNAVVSVNAVNAVGFHAHELCI